MCEVKYQKCTGKCGLIKEINKINFRYYKYILKDGSIVYTYSLKCNSCTGEDKKIYDDKLKEQGKNIDIKSVNKEGTKFCDYCFLEKDLTEYCCYVKHGKIHFDSSCKTWQDTF